MRILIAEDNRFYRLALQQTVANWGYEVVGVSNGLEAWELLQEKDAPTMAILDWLMPGMSGLELCQKVRSLDRATPTYIIMLTAKDGKENILTALRTGADDYISKPFDNEQLHARIQVGKRIVGLQAKLADRVGVLEKALFQSQKLEAIGRLAGGIAHDFNNLLTVITGFSDLLLQIHHPNTSSRHYVENIKDASLRGANLTRQMLAFARKQVLNPLVFNLNNCIGNVDTMLSRLIGEHIQVVTDLDNNLYPVEADPGQIDQVLINLLVNARDAMPDGGTVTISTRNLDIPSSTNQAPGPMPAGAYAVVSVSDTGCGMDEIIKSHLFEPFFTTKDIGKGTGLGLATAHGIITQSGGYIDVESEVGHGSTFSIYLPRAREPISQPTADDLARIVPLGTETILLVEDEHRVRLLLNSILTMYGYTVLEASSGEDALVIAKQYDGNIDLVITDIVMPGINGYETARRLIALRPNLQILYMSGYNDEATHAPGKADSFLPLLHKPFDQGKLLSRVQGALKVHT